MTRAYLICDHQGWLAVTTDEPASSLYLLAVGEEQQVGKTMYETADDHSRCGDYYFRVPNTKTGVEPRANLTAIARYIQALSKHDRPGFRAFGA